MKIQQFNYPVEVKNASLWRFDNAEALQKLLGEKEDWYLKNHTRFWQDWYRDVFNLDTANDFGLAVWAFILNIPLFIAVHPDDPDKPIWGFDDFDCYENFDNGNFANEQGGQALTTEQKRLILKLRYFQLTTRGDVTSVNQFLHYLFYEQYGEVYMLDGLDMSIVYVFNFFPNRQIVDILVALDILPCPNGVLLRVVDGTRDTFGFDEYNQNFDNGTFFDE